MRRLMVVIILSSLVSCAVGPDYVRPPANVPEKFKEARDKTVMDSVKNLHWKVAEPKDVDLKSEWWRIFHDEKLNELEGKLNFSNETIKQAAANYRQARALVDEARAAFFPTLNGDLTAIRQKGTGSSSFGTSTSTSTNIGTPAFTTYSWMLNANWEPDIWGLVRRTVEASQSGAQASAALLGATALSAQGSLAQYYFELRTLDSDQDFLDKTVNDYKKALKFILNQYHSGIASRADILQAQSLLESTQALAINNGVNRALYEHAIAVLIGEPPANFSLSPQPLKHTPPPIPLIVPSELLERRPDIAQAERLMQQACAQIGVAIAAYFPTLSLTGNVNGFQRGGSLGELFTHPTIGWAYGAQLAQLIFDGGLRAATVAAARAGYDSNVASYRQVVLSAFQNVEDNLSSLRILAEQAVKQDQAAETARRALILVINQYKSGTVAYNSVLTAEINAFAAEKAAIDVTGLRMTYAVGLVKALGGSWDPAETKR